MPERKRIVLGIAARGATQVSTIFIRLFEVPLLLYYWGPGVFGEWLILAAIPAALALGDFGFGAVTGRHMAMLVERKKKDVALGYFQTSFAAVTLGSIVVASLSVLVVSQLKDLSWFPIQAIENSVIVPITILLVLKATISLQNQLVYAGLQCVKRYPMGLLLFAISDLLEFGLLAYAVYGGAPPLTAAAFALTGVVIGHIVFRYALKKKAPWIKYGRNQASAEYFRTLWRPALTAMAFPLGQAISYQAPRLVLGILVSPAIVAVFVAQRQLVRFITIANALAGPLSAELALVFGGAAFSKFQSRSKLFMNFTFWVMLGISLPIMLLGPALFETWTSGSIEFNFHVFMVLWLATMFESTGRIILLPVISTNMHSRIAVYTMLCSIVILLPSVFLFTYYWQGIGTAVGVLLSEVAITILTLYECKRVISCGRWDLAQAILKPPLHLWSELKKLRKT